MSESPLRAFLSDKLNNGSCNFCNRHHTKVWVVRSDDENCCHEVRFCNSCKRAFLKQSPDETQDLNY